MVKNKASAESFVPAPKTAAGKKMALKKTASKNTFKTRYHHGDLRAALLEAAEAELAGKGIEAFSLRGVAKRAGVSHAAPAHHFGDVNGLFTALAATGYRRFIAVQRTRQKRAAQKGGKDGAAQLAAVGLGYVDFAMANPALFRLMFSSKRPDFCDGELEETARAAFEKLLEDVGRYRNANPCDDEAVMASAMATWAMVHGLADLLEGGRIKYLQNLPRKKREQMLSDMILRAAGPG